MKAYTNESKTITLIIPETQEEAEQIKKAEHNDSALKEFCKNAEIIPGVFFIKDDTYNRFTIPRGEHKNEDQNN